MKRFSGSTNLDFNKRAIAHPAATFSMPVSGDSRIEAGILERDYLVVAWAIEPYRGAIVEVELDGGSTVYCY